MVTGIDFLLEEEVCDIPFVDQYIPKDGDNLIRYEVKDVLIIPISKLFFNTEESVIDFFVLAKKRSYRSDDMRIHTAIYLNYFEKFFDADKELLSAYATIKYCIDAQKSYTKDNLFFDIKKYILSFSLRFKARNMTRYNYNLNLKSYSNKNESLRYTDVHGIIMMEISLLMNMVLPLLSHFTYSRNLDEDVDEFILEMYDYILSLYSIDIYSKLYETTISKVERNKNYNPLWNAQDIRGINVTTHTIDTSENLLLNIMPKYVFNSNIVNFNFGVISNTIGFQVIDIGYEFDYRSLSSTERDLDNNSEFDKYESYLIKENEALYLQNKVNCESTMKRIEQMFGPFTNEEIDFYIKELDNGPYFIIDAFQRDVLVFNLFAKYFGDPESIKSINRYDYIKLLISAKKILQDANMVILPYVFSSKVKRIVKRKNLNKKEFDKVKHSSLYKLLVDKYKNQKIMDFISEIMATILSSEFQIIEFDETQGINGKTLNAAKLPEILVEEVLMFVTMV